MPDTVQNDSASMTSLVSGIIGDAQRLLRQEVALARSEIQNELNKAKTAAAALGAGIVVATLGGIVLCFMFVHLLHWLTGPAGMDPATVPLWGCYGIVGGLMTVVGLGLIFTGKNQLGDVNVVPRQTVETMKENVQWLRNQT